MDAFQKLFKSLNIKEEDLKEEIIKKGVIQTVPKNSFIIEEEKYIKWLAIVIEGSVRVWQENEEREILLYYVTPVQTCVLSLSASFKDCKSVVNARTETETTLIIFPVSNITEWTVKYPSWNAFVSMTFIKSYDELLHSFRELAFHKIDRRILDYLQSEKTKNASPIVSISHSQLAKEIGTTREVVSKVLKQLEAIGKVQLQFKQIELL